MTAKTLIATALLTTVALAACSGPAPEPRNDAAPAATNSMAAGADTPTRDLSGRWAGVEGMVLDVTPAGAPGHSPKLYRLAMQWDLDHKGVFDGQAVGDTIVFTRDGIREILRPSDGDATGLKYLAGKTDCLTVKTGEGYCREPLSR